MTYEEWERTVHERVKREPVWEFWGYRKALFLYDLAWRDCQRMVRDKCGRAVAEQLIRSVGSISANVEEGHGRGFVYSLVTRKAEEVALTERLRGEVQEMVTAMRKMVEQEAMPGPPRSRRSCVNCEFRRFCNDV